MVWWGSEAYSLKVSCGTSLGNEMHMLRRFGHAQMCLWWTYTAHFNFTANPWNMNTLFLYWSERHLLFMQSESMGFHKHVWLESSSHCRIGLPLSTARPRNSHSELEFIEMVHAINYAYDMSHKVPYANSYGSRNLIRLCHQWVVVFNIALVL